MTADRAMPEFDALLSAAADAIVVADADGRILRCNAAAYRLFGHPGGTLVGESIRRLMPEAEAARHDGYMHRHLATGERRIIGQGREVEGRRADGTRFPLHLSVGRADAAGARPLFVAILHDLTQRHAAQAAAERSERLGAIGEMAGGIAHDFNNILALVIGNLELALAREVTTDVRSLVGHALEAAELGADLSGRLLAVARQSRLAPEPVNVNAAVESAAALVRQALDPRHRIDLGLSSGVGEIEVDGPRLQAALLNLLRNAQDAMPDEGVVLVTTERMTVDDDYLAQEIDVAPGDYVRISVSDTGTGMTPETRRRTFQPFFTTKPKGTGLGLATAYGFVRQSGGHVTLYSEPRQGTTVSLYLPAASPRMPRNPQPKAGQGVPAPGLGEVILVVEDDQRLRQMTELRVNALGYKAVPVPDAAAALARLAEGGRIDLMFTDIMMADGRTGLELAREIRRLRPDLPILMTTGYAGEMVDAGLVDGLPIIRKPYRQDELSAAIRRTLATRPGAL